MANGKKWTRRDQVLVLELYSRIPFGKMHRTNPDVVRLAELLGRSANSVAMKLGNYASLDEKLDRKGLDGATKADKETWAEFFADPELFLEMARSMLSVEGDWPTNDDEPELKGVREGEDTLRLVKVRKNQAVFRAMVMSAYEARCAVTGINHPDLLIASHIVPWRSNQKARLDPRNGICLNSLHDRAFDAGLISFKNDLTIIRSSKFSVPKVVASLFEGRVATAPEKFHPLPEYLEYHRDVVFEAA